MIASVWRSTWAVASSRTRIWFLRRMALARHASCFCPELKFPPLSEMGSSRLPKDSFSLTASRASQMSLSLCSWKGSRFSRMLPENSHGVWGMTLILDRSLCNPISRTWTPSMTRRDCGSSASIRRNKHWTTEDLPAPVLPTMATLDLEGISRVRSLSTNGSSGAYRAEKCSKRMPPSLGHVSLMSRSREGTVSGGSGVREMYERMRSTLTSWFSNSADWRTDHWNASPSCTRYARDRPTRPEEIEKPSHCMRMAA
mmetsp:Transcript_5267/g.10297  ORF Transcript_5267/g.10297 Transcript_5267/m.10297 type:complete len:256 (-) Transcript_5267:176-943(-)